MAKSRAKKIIQRKNLSARELDRRYVEGYRKKPEDKAWAETGAELLSRVFPRGKW